MCSYLQLEPSLAGAGLGAGGWFDLGRAVVVFDHPVEAPLDHALCIDFRATGADCDPTAHLTVELDADSARRLAEAILAALADAEAAGLH